MDGASDSLLSGLVGDYSAASIITSLFVSAIGYVAFAYGKKQRRGPQFLAGVLLMVFPYFVTNVPFMLLIAAAVVGAMWAAVRAGY